VISHPLHWPTCAELVQDKHLEARLCPALDQKEGPLYVFALLQPNKSSSKTAAAAVGLIITQYVSPASVMFRGVNQSMMNANVFASMFHVDQTTYPLLIINRHSVQAYVPRRRQNLQYCRPRVSMLS